MGLSRIASQSAIYLAGDLIRRGISLVMVPFYTHYLSPADYGTIEVVDLMVTVGAILFGTTALGDAMLRLYHDQESESDRNTVVSSALLLIAALGGVIALVGYAAAPWVSAMLLGSARHASLLRVGYLALWTGSLVEAMLVYQRMRHRPVQFVVFCTAYITATLALNVYMIAGLGLGVWGFLISKLICSLGGVVVLARIVVREAGLRFQRHTALELTRLAMPLVVSGLSLFIIHFSDRFFLARYASLHEVGLYALAYKFAFMVTYLVGVPFAQVWTVSMYAYARADDWERQFARVLRYVCALLVLAAVAIAIMADEVTSVVASSPFLPAAALVPVLAFAYGIREAGEFFCRLLLLHRRLGLISRLACCAAVLNLVLNIVLIPKYGAVGAAWGTFLTWSLYLGLCWTASRRFAAVAFPLWSVISLTASAGIVLAASGLVGRFPIPVQFALDMALVAGCAVVLWIAGYFDSEERQRIRDYMSLRSAALMHVAERWL